MYNFQLEIKQDAIIYDVYIAVLIAPHLMLPI